MGLNYPDCPCGCKHAPLYSEVIVRDVITKEILPEGEEGLLEFVTPIPHSYPGNAVLTDDLGVAVPGECEYGRSGRRFKIIGRLKKAEIRGCGDILSSKLKFANEDTSEHIVKNNSDFRVYYCGNHFTENRDTTESLVKLADELKNRINWLREQPIDALIGLISKVSKKWSENVEGLKGNQNQGLQFLLTWCTPENLVQIANDGLRGNRKFADGFLPIDDNGVHMMRSTSRGLVCHWLAGNVQVLGMFVLIQSILTKNVNILRVSSRDNGAFQSLLTAFSGESFITSGGYSISGDDLLSTIALVFFDHRDIKAGRKMSELADVRIAWGGSEAVSTVSAFPSKYDCEDIIMGPKLSMSVVSHEEIENERKAKKLARKIAIDASVFDQTGCASTHNIYVEKGSDISPVDFAELLGEGMSKVAKQIHKGEMTPEEFAAVHSARGIYDFKGKVYGDADSIWTVLYDEDIQLNKPVYSRVIFVHAVDSIEEVLQFVSDDTQTIGLAASGEKAQIFASEAAKRGAVRFPFCGKMLNFESPWDGMFIMERMIRWNTLGGPLV